MTMIHTMNTDFNSAEQYVNIQSPTFHPTYLLCILAM